jgi:hypothetical protein
MFVEYVLIFDYVYESINYIALLLDMSLLWGLSIFFWFFFLVYILDRPDPDDSKKNKR